MADQNTPADLAPEGDTQDHFNMDDLADGLLDESPEKDAGPEDAGPQEGEFEPIVDAILEEFEITEDMAKRIAALHFARELIVKQPGGVVGLATAFSGGPDEKVHSDFFAFDLTHIAKYIETGYREITRL